MSVQGVKKLLVYRKNYNFSLSIFKFTDCNGESNKTDSALNLARDCG